MGDRKNLRRAAMNGTSPASGKRSPAKPVRPRASAHQAHTRRSSIVNGSMLFLTIAAALLVIMMVAPKLGQTDASRSPSLSEIELRSAKITTDVDGKDCAQQVFDNKTGRITSSPQPCSSTIYDANGVPVPVGTIHRLDSISKSFPGH